MSAEFSLIARRAFASVPAHGPYVSLLVLNSLDALVDNIQNLIDEIRKKQA